MHKAPRKAATKTEISYQTPGGEPHRVTVLVHDPREKVQARWASGGFYETQRHGMLNTVYQRFRGGTFIDIGAAYGNHSLFFAACCQAARVYAFEPEPALFEHMRQNIAVSGLAQIQAYNLALGARPAQVGLTPSATAPERGGMLMNRIDERGAGVPMQRLDDVLQGEGLTEIRCIKIDVEGYNLPVLEGARATIAAFRPAIFCECETRAQFQAVDAFLAELGYQVWQVQGEPFVMNHTPTYLWEFAQHYDLTIIITTYNRPDQLRRLLAELMTDAGALRVLCRVYNDRSELAYPDMPAGSATFTIEYHMLPERHGKARYWQLINQIYHDLRAVRSRYYMQLPDDVRPRPGFLAGAIATYAAIADPARICLNLYLDSSRIGRSCWTRRLPHIAAFSDLRVFRTGWVDMVYLVEQRFFEALAYTIHPIPADRWRRNPRRSSGVGAQISRRLSEQAFYQVRECRLQSEKIPSLMNPDRPASEDLSIVALDPISCGVASIPGRSAQLRQAVEAVLPYVDQLYVYLNDYPATPAFLRQPKITVFRSQEHGNRGDAGKFFAAGRQRGYFLSIDDDIIYPQDYVWTLVNALREQRQTGRRVALGFHGKLMRPEVPQFYRGHARLFHFAAALDAPRAVHVLGTGTAAFHSDDLPLSHADFQGPPNMADIYFSIACQRHEVGCVVLARPAGYLRPQVIAHDQSIRATFRHADQAPTALYNSWKDWRIRL
jgi:FkbM family methyltransferase